MRDAHPFQFFIDASDAGQRLDVWVASHLPNCSRNYAATLISNGNIRIQGRVKKPGYRLKVGDQIDGRIPFPEPVIFEPEPMDLDILYEDDHLVVLNKQAGIVVHPAPGHYSGTLVNGLLYHCPDLRGIGGELRPGIVHRLDKDTSGVLIVAKASEVHRHLARQFKLRNVQKEYLALVYGRMADETGTITLPIGRHRVDRKRMSIQRLTGRDAETGWRVKERFSNATWVTLKLKTGRTHQIRVHFAAIHHPILGDRVYGKRYGKEGQKDKRAAFPQIGAPARQMLHAWRLCFTHPVTDRLLSVEAPIPNDMSSLIDTLRNPAVK